MNTTALIIIDVQQGFDDPKWGVRNNPQAEDNISALLTHWRTQQWPVIHIQHLSTEPTSPLHPNQKGCEFKTCATPKKNEIVFKKNVNSAFIGTGLEHHLRTHHLNRLVIVGLTTDHCVSTTARMAGNLGFEVMLISDATATFNRVGIDGTEYSADDIHAIHLASLNGEFCCVKNTEQTLKQYSASP